MYDTTAYYITEVTVLDPIRNMPVEVSIFRERGAGRLFGVENTWLQEECANGELVHSPFGNGDVKLLNDDGGILAVA